MVFLSYGSLRSATLLKKRLWHRYFPLNFANFLKHLFYRTPLDGCFCMVSLQYSLMIEVVSQLNIIYQLDKELVFAVSIKHICEITHIERVSLAFQTALREKCPNPELFLVSIFLYSVGLNKKIFSVNFRIQSKYRKIRNRRNSVFGHFSYSAADSQKIISPTFVLSHPS